jgi:hypothetical protein
MTWLAPWRPDARPCLDAHTCCMSVGFAHIGRTAARRAVSHAAPFPRESKWGLTAPTHLLLDRQRGCRFQTPTPLVDAPRMRLLALKQLKHQENTCLAIANICNILIKHLHWNIRLQHACICNIQIYFCNIEMKHLQHTSETNKNIYNIHMKHACIAITTCASSQTTFATPI